MVTLSWEPVEKAREYEVYRKSDGQLKKIGTTDKQSFKDTGVLHGTAYRYYVRAKSYEENGVRYKTGGLSKPRIHYFVSQAGKVSVAEKKGLLTWTSEGKADGYQLLVADNKDLKNGRKVAVGNVTQVEISSLNLSPGTYYISIRQYLDRDGERYVSAYHGAKKLKDQRQ